MRPQAARVQQGRPVLPDARRKRARAVQVSEDDACDRAMSAAGIMRIDRGFSPPGARTRKRVIGFGAF